MKKTSTSFQVVKSISNVFKTFVSTLYYNDDDDCDIFLFYFFHWRYKWARCCFYFYTFKKWIFKINFKNGNPLTNKASKSMFIKLLVYFYTMIQLSINCILMGLIIYFMFETQINYIWSLENFIKSEILCVATYIICNPSLPLNCLHCTMCIPQLYIYIYITWWVVGRILLS
jgi:hypothetical protein